MRRIASGIVLVALLTRAMAAQSADPRPAAGLDPGGVAVALISGGLDYTQPAVAARLARDGEGEIVGFDFADNDSHPFNEGGSGTAIALALIAEAPRARLIVLRAAAETPPTIARSVAFAAQSPARVVLAAFDGNLDPTRRLLEQAARRFDHILFVAAADATGGQSAGEPGKLSATPDNLLVITADKGESGAADAPRGAASTIDIAVPAAARSSTVAAARIAALAARIAGAEPSRTAREIKTRILELAGPPTGAAAGVRPVLIARPEAHFPPG